MLGTGSDGHKEKKQRSKDKQRLAKGKESMRKVVQITRQKIHQTAITLHRRFCESAYSFPLIEEHMRDQFFRSQFSDFTHHKHIGHF